MHLISARSLVAAAILAGGLSLPVAAQEITIRAGITDPLETPHGQAMVEFKRIVEEESDGRIEVQLFPSNQLGDIVEQIENVRDGAQEMSMSTPAWFSQFYPRIDMLEMPFLVKNWDEVQRVISSDTFKDLSAAAASDTGVLIFGTFPYGFRNVINSARPIEDVGDFAGLKIRLQNSPVHLATFQALGANPVAVSWNETYQAVQTGVVDGLENSNAILLSHKFYEVAKYVSNTRHFFGTLLVYISPSFYEGLSAEDQALLTRAMRAAEAKNLELSRAADESATEELRAAGAVVNDLSDEAIAAMRAAVQPVYDEFGSKFEPELSELQAAAAGK